MTNEIFILDLIGTFAFASYGSFFAIKKDFDIFGIFVCAFLTAVGGGTLRELILSHVPFYFFDSSYIITIIAGVLFTILIFRHFNKINNFMLLLDAVGLVTFAFIGSSKALDANLGLFGVLFFATITAVAGGVMRDVVMNEVPEIMHRDLYATIAIIFGAFFWLGRNYAGNLWFLNLLLALCLILRLLVIVKKMDLWKPRKNLDLLALLKTFIPKKI
jgi:uncharacterized membrane protein YeiH